MNNSLARLLDGLIATLKAEIIPRLDDEFARGQAYGAIDMINNLKPRIDWLVTPFFDEVTAQRQLLAQLDEIFSAVTIPRPAAPAAVEIYPGMPAHELEQLRNQLDAFICALIEWLGQQHAALPRSTVAAAEAAFKQHMQLQLKREMNLTPKPLFAEIAKA